jgi:preprotein translocase subunit SecF
MINIVGQRKIWFILSGSLVLVSILFLILFGLNLGIDFAGGTMMEVKTIDPDLDRLKIEQAVAETGLDLKSIQVQKIGSQEFLIKTGHLAQEDHQKIKEKLAQDLGCQETKFENVGPTVGKDLQRKAIWAVIVAALGIIFYIWWAFRRLPPGVSSFQFGVAAIIALLHDVIIVTGLFALSGHFFPSVMIDSYFIVALLTIMGFSVHDTIVVFDRLRENLLKEGSGNFEKTVNDSINQTIIRSINVSLTLVIVLLALYFLGGGGIKNLLLALIVGTVIGTYSSIFVATPLVVWWNSGEKN